jgi:hypothetical protein
LRGNGVEASGDRQRNYKKKHQRGRLSHQTTRTQLSNTYQILCDLINMLNAEQQAGQHETNDPCAWQGRGVYEVSSTSQFSFWSAQLDARVIKPAKGRILGPHVNSSFRTGLRCGMLSEYCEKTSTRKAGKRLRSSFWESTQDQAPAKIFL